MRSSFLTSLAFATATLLGTGAAFAGPLGINLPNNFYLDTTTSYETPAAAVGSSFQGVFTVGNIRNTQTAAVSFNNGDNGLFLMGVFDGFILRDINPGTTATVLSFTGGSLRYYVSGSNSFTNSSAGGPSADITTDSAGAPWLVATPESLDAFNDTLL